jgi:hypothetical protein
VDTCKCAEVGAEIGGSPVGDRESFVVGDRDNPRIRAQDKDARYFFMATERDLIWALGFTRE